MHVLSCMDVLNYRALLGCNVSHVFCVDGSAYSVNPNLQLSHATQVGICDSMFVSRRVMNFFSLPFSHSFNSNVCVSMHVCVCIHSELENENYEMIIKGNIPIYTSTHGIHSFA